MAQEESCKVKTSPTRNVTPVRGQRIEHDMRTIQCIGSLLLETRYVLKSSVDLPTGWSRKSSVSGDRVIRVSIGLKQHGWETLEQHLMEISDPSHPRYGKYLSSTEVNRLVRVAPTSSNLVTAWLQEASSLPSNLTVSASEDLISFNAPIGVVERLFRANYAEYQNENGFTMIRSLTWSIPAGLVDHIDVVEPTNSFFIPRGQSRYGGLPPPDWEREHRIPTYEELVEEDVLERGHLGIPLAHELSQAPTVKEACNRLAISIVCLSVLYGTWGYPQKAFAKNSIALVNFLGEVNNRSDIELFLNRYNPSAAKANAAYQFTTEIIADGDDQQTPNTPEQNNANKGFEGALDAQTILGLSWPVPMTTYNVGSKPPFRPVEDHQENTNEPYLAWLQYMQTKETLPHVISISYADTERSVPPEYARRVCREFAKLGARGVSILVASGDWGVGKSERCVMDNGRGKQRRFAPSFPSSCPYVTSVGATRLVGSEIVGFDGRGDFASGGGFSELFERPRYQAMAVENYLEALGNEHQGLFNRRGRGYPDIAALGYHFSVLWNGQAHLQDGTSASAPTVSAIIALVNDALLDNGHPPLGFLNPWLYSEARDAFTDITWGSNRGCNTSGFPALAGWDPATGLGTPWFPKLKDLAIKAKFRADEPWYMQGVHTA
ncbi:tripeptidyl peptidase [Blastomyces gilchristii SLH14081]|uniref:tripeptidyl-peptidase II n=1 Tax=Blastomyces gilchristii (strain SLH14081) TaxID=559298 RepID=A0A179UE32_BLAGS|nr:tripeptidyl peptidase [Blastomyces gilchristii SLH14081]OAT05518.1 tripeptidyl peptidase [Blastomyces gilchristii SLH14081]